MPDRSRPDRSRPDLSSPGLSHSLRERPARAAVRPVRRRARALLAPAVDNWPARGYLVLVAAGMGSFLYAEFFSPDPGMAAIWPVITTAPLGLVLIAVLAFVMCLLPYEWAYESTLVSWLSDLFLSAGTVVCGLGNAVLLGLLVRRLRPQEPRPRPRVSPGTSPGPSPM